MDNINRGLSSTEVFKRVEDMCIKRMDRGFDWDRYKKENIAVSCKTLEEARDFRKVVKVRNDMTWYNHYAEDCRLRDFYNEEDWCFTCETESSELGGFVNGGSVVVIYGIEVAKDHNYQILEWSDYMLTK